MESIAAANIFDKWLTSREMSIFNSFQNLTKLACVQCHSPLSTDEDRAPTILSSCTCHFFLIIQGDFLIPYSKSQKYFKSLKKVKSYWTNLKWTGKHGYVLSHHSKYTNIKTKHTLFFQLLNNY